MIPFWLAGIVTAFLGFAPLLWAAVAGRQPETITQILIEPAAVVLACALLANVAPHRTERVLDGAQGLLAKLPRGSEWIGALVIAGLAGVIGWYCFGGQPAMTDEFAQRFQSRILLSGRLAAVPPPHPEFFGMEQTGMAGGRWFTVFPVGGPLLHALGEWAGLGWLVNPVLAGLAALLLFRFGAVAYGRSTAIVAMILMAVSPFVLVMSGSQINHPKALFAEAIMLAALAVWVSADEGGRQTAAAVAIGLGAGLLASIRPFDAVLVAIPVGAFQVFHCARRSARWRSVAAQIVAGTVVAALILWANWRTTGAPLTFAYDLVDGPAHRPGFHVDPLGRSFTLATGIGWISQYLMRLNTALFESPVPALFFIVGAMLLIRKPTSWDYLLLGLYGSTLAGYAAYWFNGDFFGPRFLYPALPAILLLCARFPTLVGERLSGYPLVRTTARLILPVSLLVAWLPHSISRRDRGVWTRLATVAETPGTHQLDADRIARDGALTNAVVFVREPLHGSLTARLRGFGVFPYTAERIVADLDACGLIQGLADVDGDTPLTNAQRVRRVVDRARSAGQALPLPGMLGGKSLALVGGAPATPECARIVGSEGSTGFAYGAFFAQNQVNRDGTLGGSVIYVRDLGARNEMLRVTLGDRKWYRLAPTEGGRLSDARLVPY